MACGYTCWLQNTPLMNKLLSMWMFVYDHMEILKMAEPVLLVNGRKNLDQLFGKYSNFALLHLWVFFSSLFLLFFFWAGRFDLKTTDQNCSNFFQNFRNLNYYCHTSILHEKCIWINTNLFGGSSNRPSSRIVRKYSKISICVC